jgi:DNA-binding PadR family transcriptional regulator
MFADHTLTPKEATRLCALGGLALSPMTYSALAMSIRHFISRVIGPTPEIMGHSIELLKYEGLVEAIEGSGAETLLNITDAGREEVRELLTANVRATSTALDKLIVALKFRFMHLLEPDEQCLQADMLVDVCEKELSRLEDLRRHHAGDAGYLVSWLDHDIGLLETRLAWLTDFRARLCDRS